MTIETLAVKTPGAFDSEVQALDRVVSSMPLTEAEELAFETAVDCMNFCAALWEAMGESPFEKPDLAKMENIYDGYQGELAAAALFLAENVFAAAPEMLRGTSKKLSAANDGSVPVTVVKGFARFAKRIEHCRALQQNVLTLVDKKMSET